MYRYYLLKVLMRYDIIAQEYFRGSSAGLGLAGTARDCLGYM
jgi:hypothetical protein